MVTDNFTATDRYGAGVEKAGVRHTPGPWKRGDCDGWIIWAKGFREVSWKDCPDDVEKGEGVVIATAEHPTWGKEDRFEPGEWHNDVDGEITANARLIAAAPDLLAALCAVCNELEMPGERGVLHGLPSAIAQARDAIAKATLTTGGTHD